jgi:short-subunit dehydrogenase
MTRLFLQDMLARHSGYILLIASIAAYQPTPTYTTYAAAKAYILSMGEALNYELRNSGVSVTVLSPGITATNFFNVAGQSSTFYQRLTMMDSPTVARIGINSLLRRRSSVVPGFWNSFIAWGTRLVSRRFQAAVANLLMSGK